MAGFFENGVEKFGGIIFSKKWGKKLADCFLGEKYTTRNTSPGSKSKKLCLHMPKRHQNTKKHPKVVKIMHVRKNVVSLPLLRRRRRRNFLHFFGGEKFGGISERQIFPREIYTPPNSPSPWCLLHFNTPWCEVPKLVGHIQTASKGMLCAKNGQKRQ